jgi:hypothetical protein
VLRDSRTVSQAHYNIFKRYFGFLFYNALWVFVISSGIYETILSTYSNPSQVLLQIGNTLPKPAGVCVSCTSAAAGPVGWWLTVVLCRQPSSSTSS